METRKKKRNVIVIDENKQFTELLLASLIMQDNYMVQCITNFNYDFGEIEYVEKDLYDVLLLCEQLNDADVVIYSNEIKSENIELNALIHQHLTPLTNTLNCLPSNVSKLIYLSNLDAYGHYSNVTEVNELSIGQIGSESSAHQKVSFLAECEVNRAINEGLSAVILACGNIIYDGKQNSNQRTEITIHEATDQLYLVFASDVIKTINYTLDHDTYGKLIVTNEAIPLSSARDLKSDNFKFTYKKDQNNTNFFLPFLRKKVRLNMLKINKTFSDKLFGINYKNLMVQ